MTNLQKLRTATRDELLMLYARADLSRGREGRRLRKFCTWLLEEVF